MKDKYKQAFTWEKCLSEFFLIYKDDIKEETKFETISEKEPSSRQFKEWIHEIDNSLKQNDDIVLVLIAQAESTRTLGCNSFLFFRGEIYKYKNHSSIR